MFKSLLLLVIIGQALATIEPKISEIHTARSGQSEGGQQEAVDGQQQQANDNNNERSGPGLNLGLNAGPVGLDLGLGLNVPPSPLVIIEEKPPKCPPGEIFDKCVTPCQPTCEHPNQAPCPQFSLDRKNLNSPPPAPIIIINEQLPPKQPKPICHAGCLCQPGFVRNEFGMCIPLDQCPPLCKPHSHFEKCGPRCQPTCDQPTPRGLSICTHDKHLCVSGCFCDTGYVKDLLTGLCVLPKDCTQICPENEHYSDVGNACAPTCHNPHVDPYKCQNYTVHLPGCYCNRGFLRDWTSKKCVPEYFCPPKKECGYNEHWYDCKPCTPSCDYPKPVCVQKCEKGCDCKPGLVRDHTTGLCIPFCECPQFKYALAPAYKPPTYSPLPPSPYNPAPAPYNPAPAPYKPAPSPYKPAPAPYKPPTYMPPPSSPYNPSPSPYNPAPAPYKPAPSPYKPAPAPYKAPSSPYKPPSSPYKPPPASYKPPPPSKYDH